MPRGQCDFGQHMCEGKKLDQIYALSDIYLWLNDFVLFSNNVKKEKRKKRKSLDLILVNVILGSTEIYHF